MSGIEYGCPCGFQSSNEEEFVDHLIARHRGILGTFTVVAATDHLDDAYGREASQRELAPYHERINRMVIQRKQGTGA